MKSDKSVMRFGGFTLDPANRLLTRAGVPVELGGRYLDTLVLLASERGQLISKDRLHEEVWRGVPVTDEALSQAIMALRRALGDDAGRPRFIETVPRHGYRFVAQLEGERVAPNTPVEVSDYRAASLIGGGVLGAAAAGALVGMVYGAVAAGEGAGSALSLVLVLICVSALAALVSGLGIAGGIGLMGSARHPDWWRPITGGALGGLALGGFARLLGLDALRLLTGNAPTAIAGAGEGLAIGLTVGTSLLFARVRGVSNTVSRIVATAALGALAGLAVVALGGTLMMGSLTALIDSFPAAVLARGIVPRDGWTLVSGAFEGAMFATGIVAGMMWRRN